MRPELPPLPSRLAHLAISPDGYPVPWFVGYVNGVPDFRCSDPERFTIAMREDRCWMCGERNGSHKAFVVGPMCVVNRATAEPPCHYDCAEWAVRACPWLTSPKRRRRETDMPAGHVEAAGCSIRRNPGASAIYVTKRFEIVRVPNGVMFSMGDPVRVTWWREGRAATRAEVDESISTGLPLLERMCDEDTDPARSRAELARCILRASRWLPVDGGASCPA